MFCNRTKEFLSQKGIEFKERDVSKDEAALGEIQRRKLLTTAVILIDGVELRWRNYWDSNRFPENYPSEVTYDTEV